MTSTARTIEEINNKILAGTASVFTETELWEMLQNGTEPDFKGVDVAVIAFSSTASGSAAMLLIPVTERGVFTRARKIWLNGVPGYPGPAPNERLGVVDTQIFADQECAQNANGVPAGTRLLIDILENKEIQVKCLSEEGNTYCSAFSKDSIEFAKMTTYDTPIPASRLNEGDGDCLNHHLDTIRVGTKVLLNRSLGIVIGSGTRTKDNRKSISVSADMYEMDPRCIICGENTTNSIAIAIPVISRVVIDSISSYLKCIPASQKAACINAVDVEMSFYMKELIAHGRLAINNSPYPIFGGGDSRSKASPEPCELSDEKGQGARVLG
jgi:L-aspartate semialdehyde sulfurtransferase